MKKIYLLAFALIGAISNVFTAQAEDVVLTLSETGTLISGYRMICGNTSNNIGSFLPDPDAVHTAFSTRENSLVWGVGQEKLPDTEADRKDLTDNTTSGFTFKGRKGYSGEFVGQTYVLADNVQSVSVSFKITNPEPTKDGAAKTSFSIWSVNETKATMLASSKSMAAGTTPTFTKGGLTLSAGTRLVLIWAASSAAEPVAISNFSASYTKAEPKSYNLSIGSTGWATIYLDFNATIPTGVKVYGVTANQEGTKAQLEEVSGVIAANKGYLVNGAATSYTFNQSFNQSNEAANTVETSLLGSVNDSYVPGEAYVLSNGASGVGFYKAKLNKGADGNEGTGYFKNNANKAYLPAPASGGARVLTFDFDDNAETGINAVEIEEAAPANAAIYDLSGRRVQSAKSGLYIINGKKVIK